MKEFFESINENVYFSILILIIGFIAYFALKKIIKKIVKKDEKNQKVSKKRKTYVKLFDSTLKYILLLIVIISILQINGINVSSLVAGLGIASVIVGLALQDALKDIIAGINIILDDYFSVGDVVRLDNGVEAKVIELGIKATKMIDISTKDVYVIPNGNISKGIVVSRQLDTDIPIPYEEKIERIEKIIDIIINKVKEIDGVTDCEYKGVQNFGESQMYYKIRTYCNQELKPQISRDVNRIVKQELDDNDIKIPYNQVDIHTKN